MPAKYVSVDALATLVHYRGATTLPDQPPDTSKGAAILCLHDAGGNGNVFAPLLDVLAERHSPLAYDQPGHGRSAGLDSLGDITAMARHAYAAAAAMKLSAPVVLGDGLGAAVALETAIADASLLKAVVLTGGATAKFDLPPDTVELLGRITAGKARREFDRSGYAPDTARTVFEKAFAEWLKTDPRATLGDRQAQVSWDANGRLGGLTCPVLIVVGEHEEAPSRVAAQALAGQLANAQVVQLAGAGRRGVVEQPEGLAALV